MGSIEGSEAQAIIITSLYVIVMLVALAGNIRLIYIVYKVGSLISFMFVNMAVADLLVTLVMMPWSIAHFYTGSKWLITGTLGDITCRGVIFTAYFTVMASILCLIFIALDRFYAIIYPFHRYVWFRNAKVLTPLIWILSMVLMSVIPVTYILHATRSGCEYNFKIWPGEESAAIRGVLLYIFAISYLIPLFAISILYAKIGRKLWFHKAAENPLTPNQCKHKLKKRKVIRFLIIIVIVFALCWLPSQAYHVFLAVTTWEVKIPNIVMYLCYWFGHANSAINPWLCIFFNRNMAGMNRIKWSARNTSSKREAQVNRRVKKETSV